MHSPGQRHGDAAERSFSGGVTATLAHLSAGRCVPYAHLTMLARTCMSVAASVHLLLSEYV